MNTTPTSLLKSALIVALFACASCTQDTPTGVKSADLRGTWSGTFSSTILLGRTLTGDLDWVFSNETFKIVFFNAPAGQAERLEGNWKFSGDQLILTLRSSFPIDSDIGARDSLFISILNNEMSLKSVANSDILLQKVRSASLTRPANSLLALVPGTPSLGHPSGAGWASHLGPKRPTPHAPRASASFSITRSFVPLPRTPHERLFRTGIPPV